MAANIYRTFPNLGILASVTVHRGNFAVDGIKPLSIDEHTGAITLPAFINSYAMLTSIDDAVVLAEKRQELDGKLPTHFTLEVAHEASDRRVIVAQREKGDRYSVSATPTPFGELLTHTAAPCKLQTRALSDKEMADKGLPRLELWFDTQMQNQRGSNRADIIRVTEGGSVSLHRVLMLWMDGQFRLVSEPVWEGQLHLRNSEQAYELHSEDARVQSAYFGNDDVKLIMKKYVFVPDMGYPSIEGWLQVLLLPQSRQLVHSTKDLTAWHGSEDFWSKPEPKVALTDGQGTVEWHVYGTGGLSMGFVHLHTPIQHNGRTVDKVQIKHYSIDANVDAQGLKQLLAGDIVKIHRVVDMDVPAEKKGAESKKNPPLAFVGVIYERREEGEEPIKTEAAA